MKKLITIPLLLTLWTLPAFSISWEMIAKTDSTCDVQAQFYITEETPFGLLKFVNSSSDSFKSLINRASSISSSHFMRFTQVGISSTIPTFEVLIPYDSGGADLPYLEIYYSGVVKTCPMMKLIKTEGFNVGSVGH